MDGLGFKFSFETPDAREEDTKRFLGMVLLAFIPPSGLNDAVEQLRGCFQFYLEDQQLAESSSLERSRSGVVRERTDRPALIIGD